MQYHIRGLVVEMGSVMYISVTPLSTAWNLAPTPVSVARRISSGAAIRDVKVSTV